MEPASHARTVACSFPCFLPAADWLAWVRLVGTGLEIVTSSAVALGREHEIGWLTVWKVAGPELQHRIGAGVEGNCAPRAVVGYGGGVGVFVARNSAVGFGQNILIQNNGDIGIFARNLGTVGLGTLTTVQGHNFTGILIQEGGHLGVNNGAALIQENGGGCPPDTPIPCGGVFATENATVEFNGFGTISDNHGAGIFVEQGTNLHLGGGVTVSNNSGDGVHIQRISIGDFTPIPGSGSTTNTITGNGGASVFCDARSLVIGDLTGFSKVNCAQTSQN